MSQFMKDLISGKSVDEVKSAVGNGLAQKLLKEVLSENNESTAVSKVESKEKWQPKEWRPEYQLIVVLSTANYSGDDIVEIMAEKYNYSVTKQHVSNILNTDKAKEIKAEILGKVIEKTEKTVEENLELMERLAASRLVELLKNDKLMEDNPFSVADRSIKILEGRAKLKTAAAFNGAPHQQQNNFFNLPPEVLSRINAGLNKVQQVHELHDSKYSQRESGDGEVKRSGTDG
jgi:hypothetical protein